MDPSYMEQEIGEEIAKPHRSPQGTQPIGRAQSHDFDEDSIQDALCNLREGQC